MTKGIGILLVLLGHLQGEQIFTLSPYIHPFCVFIFSFHMPLFFIVSGILIAIKRTDEADFIETVIKRFKGIMVPYYWFSLFYLCVVIFALIKGGIAVQTLLLNIWYVVSGYGMNVLWFLPALFLGELLFIWLRQKLSSEKKFLVTICLACAVVLVIAYLLTVPQNDTDIYKRIREFITLLLRPVLVAGFISIGYYAERFCEKDNNVARFFSSPGSVNENGKIAIKRRIAYIFIGIALLGICLVFSKVNNGIDVRSMVVRNIFFFLLCSLTGSFGLIIMCKGLPAMKLVCFWGTGSLVFMATHNSETVLYYAMKLAMYVNQYLTRARGYICYAIIVSVIVLYSTVMIYVIQKFAPFIIGKPYKKLDMIRRK